MKLLAFFIIFIPHLATAEFIGEEFIGYSYPDEESRVFLVKVLESLNKEFTIKENDSKVTIFWKPENEAQEKEVSDRVSQYNFIKNACPNSETPLPNESAKKELSC